MSVVALDHPRFRSVWSEIFTKRLVADCMTHSCAMVETGGPKLDACCQYGCDVDLFERDAILAHADDIRRVLRPEANAMRWFDDDEPELDPDAPSGTLVRTEVLNNGCVFLAHDRRGCAIHRAGLERGWDWRVVKPTVCQLFPLTYTTDAIVISDDYADYSCAHLPDAPTLYRVGRTGLAEIFGEPLVRALDAIEASVTARRLPVV
jgi:Fe-S-cluster containining protein